MPLEKTDQAVSQSIQLFNDFAKQGIEFVQQQSPDLCNQIVLRAEVQYGCLFFIFLVISSILFLLACKWKRYEERIAEKGRKERDNYVEEKFDEPSVYFFTRFMQIVSFIPFFIGGFINLYGFISIFVAPKVYLVEYFTALIR